MQSRVDMALHLLDYAHQTMKENLQGVTLEEALFVPVGGYRSALGTLKHAAGWSHVYRSYAFDLQPKRWSQIDWPHGLRDTVIKSERYLHDVIEWYDEAHRQWLEELAHVSEAQLDELRPLHWGQSASLTKLSS